MSSLFRKKSMERISSPEQLNAYIRVSTPSVWLLLSAIVLLLAGVCVWSIFGHLDTTLPVVAVAEQGAVTAYVRQSDADKVAVGMAVDVNGVQGTVAAIRHEPLCVNDAFTDYMRHLGALQTGEWVLPVTLDIALPDGVHAASIIIDTVSPMSFVLN